MLPMIKMTYIIVEPMLEMGCTYSEGLERLLALIK